MGEIFTYECDGCGRRHESRTSTALADGWCVYKIQKMHYLDDLNMTTWTVIMCSPECWIKGLRDEADRIEKSLKTPPTINTP